MAYSPSLLRVPCSADCTCRQIDPITLRNLVCYDSRIMNDMAEIENPHDDDIQDEDLQFDIDIFSHSFFHQHPIPWGVTFKFPQWVIKNHPAPETPSKNQLSKWFRRLLRIWYADAIPIRAIFIVVPLRY